MTVRRGLVAGPDHEHEGLAAEDRAAGRLRHQERLLLDGLVNSALTNMPGSSRPCGLGKRARNVTVPVLSSTIDLGELDRAGKP